METREAGREPGRWVLGTEARVGSVRAESSTRSRSLGFSEPWHLKAAFLHRLKMGAKNSSEIQIGQEGGNKTDQSNLESSDVE